MTELNGELWRDIYYASFDDLRLHVRHYPAAEAEAAGRPSVFPVSPATAGTSTISRAICPTIRSGRVTSIASTIAGRGGSQYDRHWRNYTPFIELLDTLDFMTLQDLHRAAIVGTSRGGIIAMMMAALRPTAMGAVVLNDIGPVIETTRARAHHGLCRTMPVPQELGGRRHAAARDERARLPRVQRLAMGGDGAGTVFDEQKGRPARGLRPQACARHRRRSICGRCRISGRNSSRSGRFRRW